MKKLLLILALCGLYGCTSPGYMWTGNSNGAIRHACFTEYIFIQNSIYPRRVCGYYGTAELAYYRRYYQDQHYRARLFYQIRRNDNISPRAKEPSRSIVRSAKPKSTPPVRRAKRRGGG